MLSITLTEMPATEENMLAGVNYYDTSCNMLHIWDRNNDYHMAWGMPQDFTNALVEKEASGPKIGSLQALPSSSHDLDKDFILDIIAVSQNPNTRLELKKEDKKYG